MVKVDEMSTFNERSFSEIVDKFACLWTSAAQGSCVDFFPYDWTPDDFDTAVIGILRTIQTQNGLVYLNRVWL